MLEAQNLTRQVGRGAQIKTLLKNVSFRLEDGARLAILGPSGSGKTSLLRLLLGLDPLALGKLTWRGRVLDDGQVTPMPPEQRHFAMTFQDLALYPHLDVTGNVGFGLHALTPTKRQERVSEMLENLQIAHLARRGVDSLSGGERQKVALARALVTKPEILLLDEPLNSVDRLARVELLPMLRRVLNEQKITLVIVTHDARDALDLGATDVLILNNGLSVASGAFQSVITQPGTDWVRAFLASGLSRSPISDVEGENAR